MRKRYWCIVRGTIHSEKYSWLNLPKDARIKNIIANRNGELMVTYTSRIPEIYQSDGDFGFEISIYPDKIEVPDKIEKKNEVIKNIFKKRISYKRKRYFAVVSKWIKK